jgi:hypothetical protein
LPQKGRNDMVKPKPNTRPALLEIAMQVIGLCRFSYPALGGFQVEHASIEERCAFLYSEERMQERFAHFETIMLPSIAQQTDPDFTFVIVIGDTLPKRFHDRLLDLTSPYPQIRIDARAPGPHRAVMQDVLNEARRDIAEPCLQFRHDDDDAIGLTFVASLREAASDCAALLDRHRMVAFDFAQGYIVRPCADGLLAEETRHPFWGVALAMYVRGGVKKGIMNFAHGKMHRFMPSLSFSEPHMFLRGHNDFNDSRQGENVAQPNLKLLNADGEQMIRETFGLDADHIRQVFAGR